jgi:tetratricopeptide (TPR) repeat protein
MATAAEYFAMALRYHGAGDLALAEQYSLAVLKDQPGHAEALHLLGVIAWRQGNMSQAFDYLRRSLTASNGRNEHTWKHLGDVLVVMRNLPSAVTAYDEALRLRPNFGEAHDALGNALQHLGRWDRAVGCHREAVRFMPSSAQAYDNLGNALRGLEKWAEALVAFKQAFDLQPNSPELAYKLGISHHEQGDLDQAVAYYRQALRLRPAFADVCNSLATAFKEQGLFDEAIAQYQETLRLHPDHALAYFNLSKFAAEGRYQFAEDQVTRIKTFMTSPRCSASDCSLSCFTLAALLSKQGAYDEAFGHYREAKGLRRRYLQELNAAFDAPSHQAMVDRVIAVHDEAYFARVKGWGLATEMPVFIVGMPRSGSTLVEQILASHPNVFGAGEQGEVPQFITRFVAEANRDLYATPLLPDQNATRALGADYLQRIAQRGGGAQRVTIKTLQNFLHLGLIATLFPQARIIHCRRDPIDTCLSCFFTNFKNIDFALSLEDIGAYYAAYEKVMAHWSGVLPLEILEVTNEDLIQNQEAVTRKMLAYCGLDWQERCLTFWSTRRVVQTASSVQVRKPISAKGVGRWKHYRSHLGPLFKALGRADLAREADATSRRD